MSTRWGSADYEVFAATLLQPRPLYHTFLPLDSGLSVLYGKNGAGKSRTLEALRAAITGTKGRAHAWLHLRIRDPGPDGDSLTTQLIDMLLAAGTGHSSRTHRDEMRNALRSRGSSADEVVERNNRDVLVQLLRTELHKSWEDLVDYMDDLGELEDEVASAAVLTLIPVGSNGNQHRWRVYVSALPSDETPRLSVHASAFRASWTAALGVADADERAMAFMEACQDFEIGGWDVPDEDGPTPFGIPGEPETLVDIGTLELDAPLCAVYGAPDADLEASTLRHLMKRGPLLVDGTSDLRPRVIDELDRLSERASELYAMVFEDAPRLRCGLAPVEEWLTGSALTWVATPEGHRSPLPLDELSHAQQRWAGIAIAAVLTERGERAGRAVMLLDEPELALHGLAVRRMADGLHRLATTINVDVFAATHSATLLDAPDVNLLHVARAGDGTTVIGRMTGVGETDLEQLGMTKSDLLQLTRVFVIVEGLHDQIVLEETCGYELESAHARIVTMRGASNAASLIDAAFLLRFTDATFLVVLDAVPQAEAEAAWVSAHQAWARTRDHKTVKTLLKEQLPGSTRIENKFLRELMETAIVAGEHRRLRFHMLPAPDVIYYLPLSAFSDASASWEALATQHEAAGTGLSFKEWLSKYHQFAFDEDQIRRAAQSLDRLHPDLTALASTLTALANR